MRIHRFYRPVDHLGLLAGTRRQRCLDVLNRRLQLFVAQAGNRIAMLNLVFPRHEQREDFAVCGGLGFGHPSYRPLPLPPEMAQQGRDKFLVQNRAVTRTVRTAAAVFIVACGARAPTGHAAAPPSSEMNLRRPMKARRWDARLLLAGQGAHSDAER
jgi:hypothetical protein